MADLTPYATAAPLLGKLPDYIQDDQERQRIAAYSLYEAMYWNVPGTFKLSQRGSNDDPIYIPAARQIVETFNRFLAPGLEIVVDPAYGTPQNQELATQVWADFSARERFYSKFNTGKRYGLIRGDWAWHIWADPEREPGSKVSIYTIDPASLFPIYDVNNIDNIIGWHIIDTVVDNDGKAFIVRQMYLKQTLKGGPSPILYEKARFEVDDWGGPGMDQDPTPVEVITPLTVLPQPIDTLPIYVVNNFEEPGALWGASELRGMERIIAAVNQSISDEELTLALEGLGVYWTDAGTPVDDDGNDAVWNMGPGRVLEVPGGKKMYRLQASGTMAPFQEHLKYLHDQIDQTFGHSGVSKGKVDVSVAESGIALLLELGPLIARAEEREVLIRDVHQQLLYGIGKWFSAYEGSAFNSLWENGSRWMLRFGQRLPRNQEGDFKQTMELAQSDPQIVPMVYIRDRLRKLGFDDMPPEEDLVPLLEAELNASAQREQDAVGQRLDAEAGGFLA